MTRDEYRATCAKRIACVLAGNVTETQWDANPAEHWRLSEAAEIFDSLHGIARVTPILATKEMIKASRLVGDAAGWVISDATKAGDLTNAPEKKP